MKTTMKLFAAIAIIAAILSSCATTKGTGYQNHLRNKNNGCLHSDFGCGWANKGNR